MAAASGHVREYAVPQDMALLRLATAAETRRQTQHNPALWATATRVHIQEAGSSPVCIAKL